MTHLTGARFMASSPRRATPRPLLAHGLTIAQMAELVALDLRASEPRPRFRTIQACPRDAI
jgi:hypothetical protein